MRIILRWWRWLVVMVLMAFILPMSIALILRERERRALRQALDATTASDPGWTLAELMEARPQVPDEENAALLVLAIHSKSGFQLLSSNHDAIFENLPDNVQLNAEQQAVLKTAFASDGVRRAAVRQLANRPSARVALTRADNPQSAIVPTLQEGRECVGYLHYDLLDLSDSGDRDGCVTSWRAMLNCQHSLAGVPSGICVLVRVAMRTSAVRDLGRLLAQTEFADHQFAAFQAELIAESHADLLLDLMRGERAQSDQMMQFMATVSRSIPGPGASPAELIRRLKQQAFTPSYYERQRIGSLQVTNAAVAVAKRPETEQWAGLQGLDSPFTELPELASYLVPALKKLGAVAFRDRAIMRTAIVGVAAERFRLRTGRFPHQLDELVNAGLLTAVPRDPYRDAPLKCAHKPGGRWIVYSTGPDGRDHGGDLGDRNTAEVGSDLGFTLYAPRQRRLEPGPPMPKNAAENMP